MRMNEREKLQETIVTRCMTGTRQRIRTALTKHEDKYTSPAHFVRVAIIRQLREDKA